MERIRIAASPGSSGGGSMRSDESSSMSSCYSEASAESRMGMGRAREWGFDIDQEKKEMEVILANRHLHLERVLQKVGCLGDTLWSMAQRSNKDNGLQGRQFEGRRVPNVKLSQYLSHMVFYLSVRWKDVDQFTIALRYLTNSLIYIDRICERNDGFLVSIYNIHRLLLTAMLVSIKFHEDGSHSNSFFSKLGGVSLAEMNAMEKEFCVMLDYDMYISPEEFNCHHQKVVVASSI